jgi:hypothetical protein
MNAHAVPPSASADAFVSVTATATSVFAQPRTGGAAAGPSAEPLKVQLKATPTDAKADKTAVLSRENVIKFLKKKKGAPLNEIVKHFGVGPSNKDAFKTILNECIDLPAIKTDRAVVPFDIAPNLVTIMAVASRAHCMPSSQHKKTRLVWMRSAPGGKCRCVPVRLSDSTWFAWFARTMLG